jgi:hypothetical protein
MMSTPENPERATPNLRDTRKEMAANVTPLEVASRPRKPIKKAAAKKAPAKKPAAKATPGEAAPKPLRDAQHPWYVKSSYTPVKGKKLYEATGESGQISVYSSDVVFTHAVSLAEPDRPGADWLRKGRICSMHTDRESAERMMERILKDRPEGDKTRCVIVEAREYRGQPADRAKRAKDDGQSAHHAG